ncbi:MAG: F0F1 ATP synthase subunit delta [Desulfobacterales bacterium]|nr:F0F1 ATP synthase subunit delta [Desulfobacterales bacterium]
MADYVRQGQDAKARILKEAEVRRRKAPGPGPAEHRARIRAGQGAAAARDLREARWRKAEDLLQAEHHGPGPEPARRGLSAEGGGVMKNLAIARRYAKALLHDRPAGRPDRALPERAAVRCRSGGGRPPAGAGHHQPALRKRGAQAGPARRSSDELDAFRAVESFLVLLFEKGRFGFLGAINDFFQKLADELKGVGRATVTSAGELSAEAVERIREALSQRTGKDIVLEVKQDPEPDRRGHHADRRSCVGRQHQDAITQHERIFKKG